jgi:predicted DNA-binding ArsR family transcriptional regulator
MPSKKRKEFEALSLETPLFRTINLNMFEVVEQYNDHIKKVLEYLDEGKTATSEVVSTIEGGESVVIEISRSDSGDKFVVYNRVGKSEITLGPNEFMNWLYTKAPYMAFVGFSNL